MTGIRKDHARLTYEALMLEYAAGALDRAQRLIVSTHLSLSPKGRDIVRHCETLGGAMIERYCEPVAMSTSSLDRVLGSLDDTRPRHREAGPVLPEDLSHLPPYLQEQIARAASRRLKWKRAYPGLYAMPVPIECRRSRAHIFKLKPAVQTPRHRHTGLELTLVLDGGFHDESGEYSYGDLVVSDNAEQDHSPVACPKKGVVCLRVVSGSVELTGPLGRLLNPFVRF